MSDTDQATPVPEARVKFGPRPSQHMPAEWAEAMLTELAATRPQVFGQLLKAAALGENGRTR